MQVHSTAGTFNRVATQITTGKKVSVRSYFDMVKGIQDMLTELPLKDMPALTYIVRIRVSPEKAIGVMACSWLLDKSLTVPSEIIMQGMSSLLPLTIV